MHVQLVASANAVEKAPKGLPLCAAPPAAHPRHSHASHRGASSPALSPALSPAAPLHRLGWKHCKRTPHCSPGSPQACYFMRHRMKATTVLPRRLCAGADGGWVAVREAGPGQPLDAAAHLCLVQPRAAGEFAAIRPPAPPILFALLLVACCAAALQDAVLLKGMSAPSLRGALGAWKLEQAWGTQGWRAARPVHAAYMCLPSPTALSAQIAIEVAKGLHYLHSMRVTHFDL